ncbi:MAG: FecR domain-containing protein [Tannerella sp.]|nr:FecR domain-containing protein [Tannerella sp.]
MNRIPTHIEEILAALFSGEAGDDEVKILREWLDASPMHEKLLKEYRDTYFTVRNCRRANTSYYDVDEAWARVSSAMDTPGRIHRAMRPLLRYAAVFILAFGAGLAAMYFHPRQVETETVENGVSYTEYTVPYGSRSMITLPDSSSIWLNAGSRLRYNSTFNQTGREVFIEGEAYFKVARNEEKPFYVKTSAATLKVLGTSFNIKAYAEEDNVETTVESGSVQVLRNVKGLLSDRLILTAGQKATIVKSVRIGDAALSTLPSPAVPAGGSMLPEEVAEKTIVAKNVMTELYTSWKDARWIIEKESLESLAVRLERRYNVQISFTDQTLKNFSFSGTLKEETLEQVLEAIKLSAPVNYTVRQNRVTLSTNKWIMTNPNNQ